MRNQRHPENNVRGRGSGQAEAPRRSHKFDSVWPQRATGVAPRPLAGLCAGVPVVHGRRPHLLLNRREQGLHLRRACAAAPIRSTPGSPLTCSDLPTACNPTQNFLHDIQASEPGNMGLFLAQLLLLFQMVSVFPLVAYIIRTQLLDFLFRRPYPSYARGSLYASDGRARAVELTVWNRLACAFLARTDGRQGGPCAHGEQRPRGLMHPRGDLLPANIHGPPVRGTAEKPRTPAAARAHPSCSVLARIAGTLARSLASWACFSCPWPSTSWTSTATAGSPCGACSCMPVSAHSASPIWSPSSFRWPLLYSGDHRVYRACRANAQSMDGSATAAAALTGSSCATAAAAQSSSHPDRE